MIQIISTMQRWIILSFIGITCFFALHISQTRALEAGWTIAVPASVSFASVQWQVASQTTEVIFSAGVDISHASSTSQGFTATVKTTEPTHTTDPTLFIGYTQLNIKTGALTSNPSQPAGVTTPINGTFTAFSGTLSTSNPITFMTADVSSRNAGTWSVTPTMRLSIPQQQKSGTYEATLTFELS